jgi:hypothetical protein
MQKLRSLFKPLFLIVIIFLICSIWIFKNIKPIELINDIVKEKSGDTVKKVEKEDTIY